MLRHTVDDGGLSSAILAAQDVDARLQLPYDMLVAVPQTFDFDSLDVIRKFLHNVWLCTVGRLLKGECWATTLGRPHQAVFRSRCP